MRIYQLFSSYCDVIMTFQFFRYNVTFLKNPFLFILERKKGRGENIHVRKKQVSLLPTLTRDGACKNGTGDLSPARALQCYFFVKYMLAGSKSSFPRCFHQNTHQLNTKPWLQQMLTNFKFVPIPFLGKEGQNGRRNKTNIKVSLSRLFIQTCGAYVGLKFSKQDGQYFSEAEK